jgi:hypothetical protein
MIGQIARADHATQWPLGERRASGHRWREPVRFVQLAKILVAFGVGFNPRQDYPEFKLTRYPSRKNRDA